MPTPADRTPPDLRTLAEEVAALRREVKELRAARRLEAATVGAGGLTVAKGGRLAMATPDSTRVVDVGAILQDGYNNADGTRQQAILLRRQDGSLAISLYASPDGSGARQFAAMWDSAGDIVVSDDAASGVGLGRPYLPVGMWPAFDAGWDYWPRTSGTSFAELWNGLIYRQQPRLVVVAQASMDTSGATGQLQLTINGVAQGSPQTITFAEGTVTFGPFSLAAFGYMSQVPIALVGKRVTGTGALRASIYSATTLQS